MNTQEADNIDSARETDSTREIDSDWETDSAREIDPDWEIENGMSLWNPEAQEEFRKYFQNASCLMGKVARINGKLGNGQNSKVFWGIQYGTGMAITIKVDERQLDRKSNREDIAKKINALSRLHYPDISKLIEFIPDYDNNRSYILMEFISGKGLNHILTEEGPVRQDVVLNWACQILKALCYLHKEGHIHGNIRTANIVRRTDGSVCLCDFSYMIKESSTTRKPGNNNPNLPFNSGVSIFGTIQDKDRLLQEQQKDLYWLGYLLYRLLTGGKFHEDKSLEVQFRQLRDKVSDDAVAKVIMRALGEPTERYAKAEDMLRAFYSLPYRNPEMRRRNLSLIAATYIATAFILLGIGLNRLGQYWIDRTDDMRKAAELSQVSMAEADYTGALKLVADASDSQSILDPKCPSELRKALAEVVGAYDLAPGYKPWYSLSLDRDELKGTVRDMRLSPSGTRIAVLEEARFAFSPSFPFSGDLIQIFDIQNGKALGEVSSSWGACAEFLDDDTLLYQGWQGLSMYRISDGQDTPIQVPIQDGMMESPGFFQPFGSKIALSGEGDTVVLLNQVMVPDSGQSLRIYKNIRDNDGTRTPKVIFINAARPQNVNGTDANQDGVLLALDRTGRFLAVSSNDAVRIYALDEQGEVLTYTDLNDMPSGGYTHFEGGFYGQYFFFAAMKDYPSANVESYCAVYRISMNGGKIRPERIDEDRAYGTMRAQVDEQGVFFSEGTELRRFDETKNYFFPIAKFDSPISLLRHIPGAERTDAGSILLSTDDKRTWLCGDDSSEQLQRKTLISENVAFDLAAFSLERIVLVKQGGQSLSVLRWTEPWKDASYVIPYDPSFEHLRYGVRGDEVSAMLFREERPYFQIARSDGTVLEPFSGNLGYIFTMRYLHDYECLEISYRDRNPMSLENRKLYSSEDGAELLLDNYPITFPGPEPAPDINSVLLPDIPENAEPSDITEYDNYRVISFIEDGRERREAKSLIEDGDGKRIAEIPGACMVLKNGSLYFDDRQGHLIRTEIYTLEQLREMASRRINFPSGESSEKEGAE